MPDISFRRQRAFYIKIAVLFYIVWIVVIELEGRFAATLPGFELSTALDRSIPLIPQFVWAYMLCYFFPLLPVFVARDWHRFNRGLLAIVLANIPVLAVYLLLPVHLERPELGTSLSERILNFIYTTDYQPSANKLPSLHVIFAWLVYLMCRRQGLSRWAEGGVGFLALLISISTLFVKQHIVYDVLSGVAWAFAAWWLAGQTYDRLLKPEWDARTALRALARRLAPAVVASAVFLFALAWILPVS